MKTNLVAAVSCVGIFLWGVHLSEAGPSLPVMKPPVQSPALMTGPSSDPTALQGQWFINAVGVETVRTNEFYDEVFGGLAGANAITGYVDSITYLAGPGTPIIAFTIQATIFNDASLEGLWSNGSNRHGETLTYLEPPYAGPLVDTKLVGEFAIADTNTLPVIFQGPYRDRQPYIEAVNEDQWAWYCWNPLDPNSEHKPAGNYFVPTWDFGTIPLGQSATRRLSFSIALSGIQPAIDARYLPIVQSFAATNDVLMNRTLSLKISTWIEEIALDSLQQEEPPARLSDVSVFHNREPFLDFGDAPDGPYPTLLANDGARHFVVPGISMGVLIDAEGDGQPDATATGDDAASLADEDGASFLNPLVAGLTATVQVTVSTSGYISAWIDFDANGSWSDAGENVFSVQAVATGTNVLTFGVPSAAATTNTFARFRFATPQATLSPSGLAPDGEVEDYEVSILPQEEEELLDFGDAMDSPVIAGYPTLLVNNGARHAIVPGVFLGAAIDAEPDGQPDGTATGDDNNPPAGLDDEDGVSIPSPLLAGAAVQVQVIASVAGFLNAWIDWNSDGDWADPGEQVFINQPLIPGPNPLPVSVPLPPALVAGGPDSRWRFTTNAVVLPGPFFIGWWGNGEVEDYEVRLEVLDFGDAPEPPYPTLLASDGARHRIPATPVYYLGAQPPDADPDGQPSPDAQDDDYAGTDDEDGVFVPAGAPLVRGDSSAALSVICSTGGYLNAWLDFDGNGGWTDAGEQIAADRAMPAGFTALVFGIPAGAQIGPVVGRFRFASAAGLSYAGFAADGEVEDHEFTIYQNGPDTNYFYITNIAYAATNQATIWWVGDTNATYETQYILDLPSTVSPPWTAWGAWVTGDPLMQVDTNAAETAKHYRVVAPYSPPP